MAPKTRRLLASAGRDEATGELIVKAINTASEAMLTRLQLNGLARAGAEAQCTVLASANLADNNSMEHPVAVVPVTRRITLADMHEVPPHSLTVLRFKTNTDQ
jgi:alpha-N-arabinofuranosidase